jgi:hypothetical protein
MRLVKITKNYRVPDNNEGNALTINITTKILYLFHCNHKNEDGCSIYLQNIGNTAKSRGYKDPRRDSASIISLP